MSLLDQSFDGTKRWMCRFDHPDVLGATRGSPAGTVAIVDNNPVVHDGSVPHDDPSNLEDVDDGVRRTTTITVEGDDHREVVLQGEGTRTVLPTNGTVAPTPRTVFV